MEIWLGTKIEKKCRMTGPPVQFINRMTGLLSTSSMWLMLLGVMTSILSEALAKLTFYPQKIHMDAICDKHFAVNHSIQVAINKIPAKKRFCRVHFKPLSGDWLLGSFTTYSLQMLQPNCTVEALHLSASHEDFFGRL
ncbi:unnamed protein product [Lymnaea stagnalis]|uniref:Uncharacterized protein n=1 Tax=Lymnaea stagnalis TaxID=6523 RepID=A0AAV2HHA2_LYMST